MAKKYPYAEGDVRVIGPECFAARDGSVLSWRGENYVPQGNPTSKVYKLVLWSAGNGRYYWDAKATNGAIIFTGGEKLTHKKRLIETLHTEWPHAWIEICDERGKIIDAVNPVTS